MAWNFANSISVNDVIYAKRSNTLVGKGIVTGDYVFDDLRQEYKSIRAVKWLQVGEWEHPGNAVAKRLTDITPYTDYIEKLTAIFALDELDDVDTQPEIDYPIYSSTDFLTDVYMNEQDYKTLVNVLKMKKKHYFTGCTWSWKNIYCQATCLFHYRCKKSRPRSNDSVSPELLI